ncbi:MAG: hypothetical protein JWN70_810 [Planctomycetaceae bacterium]|nr:hypothetical protein [Planctomycetaceae bacterium]
MVPVAAAAGPADEGPHLAEQALAAELRVAGEFPGGAVAPAASADAAALPQAAFQVPLDAGALLVGPWDVADHPAPRQLPEHPDEAAYPEASRRVELELPVGVALRAGVTPDELAWPREEFPAAAPVEEAAQVAPAWAVEPPAGRLRAVACRAAIRDVVEASPRGSIAAVFPGEPQVALARDGEARPRQARVLGAVEQPAEQRQQPEFESVSEQPAQPVQQALCPPPQLRLWPFPPSSHRSGCHDGH